MPCSVNKSPQNGGNLFRGASLSSHCHTRHFMDRRPVSALKPAGEGSPPTSASTSKRRSEASAIERPMRSIERTRLVSAARFPYAMAAHRSRGSMRLKDKIAIVVGAGQSPGEGIGNGRATVLRFVQEGAKVLAVDNNLASAEETVAMARQSDGECAAFEADVTKETMLAAMAEAARRRDRKSTRLNSS